MGHDRTRTKELVKDEVIDMIRRLPDDYTLEDIHYHMRVRQRVEQAIQDAAAGRTYIQE